MVWCILLWGVAMAGFGLAVGLAPQWRVPMLVVAVAMLVGGGAADMASSAFRNAMLLSAADDAVRGRLQGVFIVVVVGGPRIADTLHGYAAGLVGTAWASGGGGLLVIVLTALVAVLVPAFWRYVPAPGSRAEPTVVPRVRAAAEPKLQPWLSNGCCGWTGRPGRSPAAPRTRSRPCWPIRRAGCGSTSPNPTRQTAALLGGVFGAHPAAVQDVLERNHVPRLHVYGQTLFLVLHRPQVGEGGHVHYLELDQFIGPNYLITTHGPRNPAVPLEMMLEETDELADRMLTGRHVPTGPWAASRPARRQAWRSRRSASSTGSPGRSGTWRSR